MDAPTHLVGGRRADVGLSRRRFVAAAGLAAAAALVAPSSRAAAAGDGDDGIVGLIKRSAASGRITVLSLRGNIRVLAGSGGNIAVLPGKDGTLMIEAGIGVSRPKILDALSGFGAEPVRHLVNTHWHFDHTDGNDWVHAAGATIVAHENTRKRMAVRHRVQGWRFTFPAAPAGALPAVTFKRDLTLRLNGSAILLDHYEPAHTDSDASVYFTEADVIHVGDTWWNGAYPFIDYSSGGNIDGAIVAAEANVARTTDRTIVIPGHGPVGDRAGLTRFRDMLLAVRERVAALKEAGRSVEQAVAAKPTAVFDDEWGKFVISPDAFTELVYAGV